MFWALGGPPGAQDGQSHMFQAGQLHFDLVQARIDPRFVVSERSMPLLPAQELVVFLSETDFPTTI